MKRWYDRKSCGQSLRNCEDRISELPEALLLKILSLLPTKKVVATSVLSKQWRFLWKTVPRLQFRNNATNNFKRFSNNVSKCLLSHQALESLHLEIYFGNNNDSSVYMDFGTLMGIALGLHVREFVLEAFSDESVSIPTSLYNCGTLETLKLSYFILVDVPFPVSLKSLKTLQLYGVEYKDDESVLNLLSGCSSLENLVVHRFIHGDVKTFNVNVPSLQRLTLIVNNSDEEEFSVYVINAPSLKYLEIKGFVDVGSCLNENTPDLVEANVLDVVGTIFEDILGSIISVTRLSLKIASPWEVKFLNGSIFYQLVYLELHTYELGWWNLLTLMLDGSPNLQVLKLISKLFRMEDPVAYTRWNKPKYVPECLLLHFETFVWTNYGGRTEDEKEVAKYILRNANRLEKATFSVHTDKRLEMLKELESVVWASNSCQLCVRSN